MLLCVCLAKLADSLMDARLGDSSAMNVWTLPGRPRFGRASSHSPFLPACLRGLARRAFGFAFALARLAMSGFTRAHEQAALPPWRPGVPLAVAASLALLCGSLPRLLVRSSTVARAGIFAAIASIEMAGSLSSLGRHKWRRRGCGIIGAERMAFLQLRNRLLGLALAVGSVAWRSRGKPGDQSSFPFRPAYSGEASAFKILLFAAALNY